MKKRISRCLFSIGLLSVFSVITMNCSRIYIPSLEASECTDSRDNAKKFYSIHFGNEMRFSSESLKIRENFLTPEFIKSLRQLDTSNDVFTTNSDDIPRTFRLGGCKVIDPMKTDVEILLLWREGYDSRQQNIHAEMVKQQDKWLINRIVR